MTDRTAEPWWMIERDDDVVRPMYFCWLEEPGSKHFPRGQHGWTPSWQRGARFTTKQEAEAHTNGDPLLFVRDHCMMTTPSIPSDEGLVEAVAMGLHKAFDPFADYTYSWGDPLSSQGMFRDLARAALAASGHTALLREIEGLREALERVQDEANTVGPDWRETASMIDSICVAALSRPLDEQL